MPESVDSGADLYDEYARKVNASLAGRSPKERAEAIVNLIIAGNKITDIQYCGHKIADDSGFRQQKELATILFQDLALVYQGTSESVFHKFLEGTDQDYVVGLWQATRAASSYNQHAVGLDEHLRRNFILGFYATAYELACKAITKLVQNLFATGNLSCGDARQLMCERSGGKYRPIADYFDNFLRNAINHAQYLPGAQTGFIDAWNAENGVNTPKRSYQLDDVFRKTVKLLFLIVSMYVVFNEKLETYLIQQCGLGQSERQ
jgi:hypothetical protein